MDALTTLHLEPKFEPCLRFTLAEEGGLVDDAHDPGGKTKYGISQRSYPHLDIARLTLADAARLYERDFWRRVNGQALPSGLDLAVFDFGVTSGPSTAVKHLQHLMNCATDGIIGPKTLGRIANSKPSLDDIIAIYCQVRLTYYRRLATWERFGRGWTARVNRTREAAMELSRTQ